MMLFSLIWGVFQTYHSAHLLKGTSEAKLSAVGAVQNSVSLNRIEIVPISDISIAHDSHFVYCGKVRRSLVRHLARGSLYC